MKKTRRLVTFILAVALVFGAFPEEPVFAKKAKPAFNKTAVTMCVGQKKALSIKKVTKKQLKKVKWTTSNSKVVKVTAKKSRKSATIKAISAGKATIKAKVAGKTLKCKVTVKANKKNKPAVNTTVATTQNTVMTTTAVPATTTQAVDTTAAATTTESPAPVHKHAYDEGKVVVDATCTTDGKKVYTCTCGSTRVEEIPATGHKWDDGVVTTNPTYKAPGVKTYTCSNCQETRTESIPMLNETEHSWNEGIITTAPTCTAKGVKTYTCKNCGGTKTEEVAATGHHWNDGVITTQPTYTAAGVKTYTCTDCKETKTESIPALVETSHSWGEGVVTKAPTCTTKGIKTYTCANCGDLKTEEVAATGHSWNEGVITKAPTCTTKGVKTYTCTNCGGNKTEEIAVNKDSHVYQTVSYQNPSFSTNGEYKIKCKECGDSTGYYYTPITEVPTSIISTTNVVYEAVSGSKKYLQFSYNANDEYNVSFRTRNVENTDYNYCTTTVKWNSNSKKLTVDVTNEGNLRSFGYTTDELHDLINKEYANSGWNPKIEKRDKSGKKLSSKYISENLNDNKLYSDNSSLYVSPQVISAILWINDIKPAEGWFEYYTGWTGYHVNDDKIVYVLE